MDKRIILEISIGIVRDVGYEKLKISDLADTLGVSHAAIYNYFRDKNTLLRAVAIYKLEEDEKFFRNLSQHLQRDDSWLYRYLWMLAQKQREYCTDEPQLFKLTKYYYEHDSKFKIMQDDVWQRNLITLFKSYTSIEIGQLPTIISTIFSAFSIFYVPYFSLQWSSNYYQSRFDELYNLVVKGKYLHVA